MKWIFTNSALILLLSHFWWAKGTATFPLSPATHSHTRLCVINCAVYYNGFMEMLLQDLFLHKATSREVIISLFTPMPNAMAHSTYLEIKRHNLSSAGAGSLTGNVNYPDMVNTHAMIIFLKDQGLQSLDQAKIDLKGFLKWQSPPEPLNSSFRGWRTVFSG